MSTDLHKENPYIGYVANVSNNGKGLEIYFTNMSAVNSANAICHWAESPSIPHIVSINGTTITYDNSKVNATEKTN